MHSNCAYCVSYTLADWLLRGAAANLIECTALHPQVKSPFTDGNSIIVGLNQQHLSEQERRAGIALASIYGFRMFGLFLILPVFALFAEDLEGATPYLTGLAVGIYGLTQAMFQIPFGWLSDRVGRKPVIAAGLLIFAVGSLLAGLADSIIGIIVGRALQGAGAIAAALMALAADLSREEHRTKMMALIGASIGLSFALSMVMAPSLDALIGVSGMFLMTGGLAFVGIAVLFLFVPTPRLSTFHRDAEMDSRSLSSVIRNPDLLRLDLGIFALHFTLMSAFLVVPLMLRDVGGMDKADHWQVYLPTFVVSLIVMLPLLIFAERRRQVKPVFVSAIVVLALGLAGLSRAGNAFTLVVSLMMFFTAFNLLEASLPSLISKTASASHKGTAMGVYASSQFLGTFLGGIAGGYAHGVWGAQGALWVALLAVAVWFCFAVFMSRPKHLSTYLLNIGQDNDLSEQDLLAVTGVAEAAIIAEEGVAYLKVEKHILDEQKLLSFAQRS